MAVKPEIKLSVQSSGQGEECERWVLDGGVSVSRRFDFQRIERRASKLLPRDVAANSANDRKSI